MKKSECINSPLFMELEENKIDRLETKYGGIPPLGSGTKTDTSVNNDSKYSEIFDILTWKEKTDHKKTFQSDFNPFTEYGAITPLLLSWETITYTVLDFDKDLDICNICVLDATEYVYSCLFTNYMSF